MPARRHRAAQSPLYGVLRPCWPARLPISHRVLCRRPACRRDRGRSRSRPCTRAGERHPDRNAAHPVNTLVDFALIAPRRPYAEKQGIRPVIICDNTCSTAVQRPRPRRRWSWVYSATKYIGGHSDLIAGAAIGPKARRSRSGRCAAPSAQSPSYVLDARPLAETLSLRMQAAARNAVIVADYLSAHPMQAVHAFARLPGP